MKKNKLLSIISFVFALAITSCTNRSGHSYISTESKNRESNASSEQSYISTESKSEESSVHNESTNEESNVSSEQSIVNGHLVTFDSNGGSPVESQIIKHGEKIAKPTDPTKDHYTFNNWTYKDEEWSFIGYVVTEDMTLIANWNINMYQLTLNNSNPRCGNLYGDGLYAYDSDVTITATPAKGFSFVGWYDSNDALVSSQTTYTFKIGLDLTLTSKWNQDKYTITLDPDGGTVSQTTVNVSYGDIYTLPIPERKGYEFNGWYDESTKINSSGYWNYTSNKNLTANWLLSNYTITYKLNGGTFDLPNPTTYTVYDSVTFTNPTKQGYSFAGWYKDNDAIVGIPTGSTGDITIEARWTALKNALTVTSSDDSKGTVSIISGTGYSGETITVVASPKGPYSFAGWRDANSRIHSYQREYSFAMPGYDCSLTGEFFITESQENCLGIRPNYFSNNSITYGLYPQRKVSESALLSTLNNLTTPDINGWYLYNGEYYAKTSATPSDSNYVFDDGTPIVSGETYWFKCEPIVWKILSNNDGVYYLLSSVLLDNHIFDSTSNNYKDSEIRSWLNNEFYNSAFAWGDSYIQTTTVDNSAATTKSSDNPYACENTEDKVFLPSYQDYLTTRYGFSSRDDGDEARCCDTTDWARARGVWYLTVASTYSTNGCYWTRSPRHDRSDLNMTILNSGSFGVTYEVNIALGVRPAITLEWY